MTELIVRGTNTVSAVEMILRVAEAAYSLVHLI